MDIILDKFNSFDTFMLQMIALGYGECLHELHIAALQLGRQQKELTLA